MKRNYIIILILAFLAQFSTVNAQKAASKGDRQKWFKEMREYKHSFLAKELELTEKQQEEFFPLYDAMESETHKANKDVRQIEKDLSDKGNNVTDSEYEKAAEALFKLKSKEADIEMSYFEKFKNVLTKKQLFQLKGAEWKFTRKIMNHHKRHKKNGKK